MSVCLSVHLSPQLRNRWTYLNEIRMDVISSEVYHNIVLFNSLQSIITTWRKNKFVRWDQNYRHLPQEYKMMYNYVFSEDILI
jgi:hypothetical protein